MSHVPYPYKRLQSRRYIFVSEGKRRIKKVVDFVPLGIRNITNLGFGDLLPDGSIDDKANSNNGDLIKVMATVVEILKQFTTRYPNTEIYFEGSTDERTRFYSRILRSYYELFSKDFRITAIIGTETDNKTIPFNPAETQNYLAFLIRRIS